MPRPKKEQPKHGKYYEIKAEVDKKMDGTAVRKSFYSLVSREDAWAQADKYKLEKELARQTGISFVEKEVTFKAWSERWLKSFKLGKVKDNTYRGTYESTLNNHLLPYFGKALLTSIKPIDIQDFFDIKAKTNAEETIEKMRACLKAVFETAVENDQCLKNPITKSCKITSDKEPAVKRTYSQEEYDKVYNFARAHSEGLCIMVLLATGISRSELLGLKWADIDFTIGVISINQGVVDQKDTKSGKWVTVSDGLKNEHRRRSIPIDTELSGRLNAKSRTVSVGGNKKKKVPPKEITTEFIFHNSIGEMFSPKNWSRRSYDLFMRDLVVKHPDVPALTPHELRHTRATLWKNNGVDLFSIAKLMGHVDLNMLSRKYAHNDIDTLKKALGL